MKLINPDYMTSSDDNFNNGGIQPIKSQKTAQNSHSLGNISALNNGLKALSVATTDDIFLMRKKSRSREGINLGSHGVPISSELKLKSQIDNAPKIHPIDGIYHAIRPSPKISSEPETITQTIHTHEKSHDNNLLHINEEKNGTPRKNNFAKNITSNGGSNGMPSAKKLKELGDLFVPPRQLPLLPDTKEVDWSSLVDSAITQINEGLKKHYYDANGAPITVNYTNGDRQSPSSHDSLSSSSSLSSACTSNSHQTNNLQTDSSQTSLPELQSQVTQLEDRITQETKRRKSLETAVQRLTEENRRLQDESQAAVQQLRRFSEWFFQTIDKQT